MSCAASSSHTATLGAADATLNPSSATSDKGRKRGAEPGRNGDSVTRCARAEAGRLDEGACAGSAVTVGAVAAARLLCEALCSAALEERARADAGRLEGGTAVCAASEEDRIEE